MARTRQQNEAGVHKRTGSLLSLTTSAGQPPHDVTLRQADSERADLYAISEELTRLPWREELARLVLSTLLPGESARPIVPGSCKEAPPRPRFPTAICSGSSVARRHQPRPRLGGWLRPAQPAG